MAITWLGTPCIAVDRVRALVSDGLGGALDFRDEDAEIVVSVEVAPNGPAWRADVQLVASRTSAGKRRLDASTCQGLEDSLAFYISVLIGEAADRQARAEAEPKPVERRQVISATTTDELERPHGWSVVVELDVVGAVDSLGRAGVGFGGALQVTPRDWPTLVLGGAGWLDRQAERPGVQGSLTHGYGRLGLCTAEGWIIPRGTTVCLGAELGVEHARAAGALEPALARSLVYGAVATQIRYSLRWSDVWSTRIGADAAFPWTRNTFEIEVPGQAPEVLFEAPWVYVRLHLAVEAAIL